MEQACNDKYWYIVTECSVGGVGLCGCDGVVPDLRNVGCTGS